MHEDRVQDRVHVVRPQVGHAHDQHVGLALHLDELLAVQVRERALVHRLDLAGVHARELVRRLDPPEELAAHARRRHVVGLLRGHHQRLVARAPLPLALVQEAEVRRERLGVHRRLDLEDLHAGVLQHPAHAVHRVVDRAVALARVHVRLRVQHRVHVVVVLAGSGIRRGRRRRTCGRRPSRRG